MVLSCRVTASVIFAAAMSGVHAPQTCNGIEHFAPSTVQ